jgi:ABC-type transport system substrate-binding protein
VTFPLDQGVRRHDGKPFTAADVVCTWDLLMEKSPEKLRFNPRKSFYKNLDQVTPNGDYQVTFHLKRPAREGLWGMPPDLLKTLTGYNPDVQKNRAEARQIMEKLGYGQTTGCRSRSRRATSQCTAIRQRS